MNKDTSWQPLLSMVLNLADGYADLLIIEGIYILKMMSKTLQHRRNCKLQIFVNSEWFSWFKKSNNKIHDIMLYDKWYKNMMAKNNFPNNRGVINKKSIISHREINGFKYYKKFWLIIGVDDYNPPFSKLNNAINDAKTMENLANNLNFSIFSLLDSSATKKGISHIIQNTLFNTLSNGDLLVVSFHGHGYTLQRNDRDFGFIVPQDATDVNPSSMISMETIGHWVQMLECKHVLIIMDCCFSGFMAARSPPSLTNENNINNVEIASLYKNMCQTCRIAINAGTHDQVISDGGWGNNSILTGLMASYQKYDETKGSMFQLMSYLSSEIPKHTVSCQTPTMGRLSGDQGGDLYLAL